MRKSWVDNFGNDIESVKMYRDAYYNGEARLNVQFVPVQGENMTTWFRRARRAGLTLGDVQKCHFDGTQKVFFCHKNPATCWVCDTVTIALFFTKMGDSMLEIDEIKELLDNTFWEQKDDGSFAWKCHVESA